jgi:hypothetical protein
MKIESRWAFSPPFRARFAKLLRWGTSAEPAESNELSPAPRTLIANRVNCEIFYLEREVDRDHDTPLAALYRMYEHLVLDQSIDMRNEIEHIWLMRWPVRDLPDPHDPAPECYACLACLPALLCLAFNERIRLGLPRHAPSIFSHDDLDVWSAQERVYEEESAWATRVPRLKATLAIPHWDNEKRDFLTLDGFEAEGACAEFAAKNILILRPHIHFK